MIKEIGSAEALLSSISTLKDGSIKVSFEINPNEKETINNLLSAFLAGEKLFTLGIIKNDSIERLT